jgi:hypothetical protein
MEVLDLAETLDATAVHDAARQLTVHDIRGLLIEHAEEILRALASVPVLGPAIEEPRPVDLRRFVRSMAPHIQMN